MLRHYSNTDSMRKGTNGTYLTEPCSGPAVGVVDGARGINETDVGGVYRTYCLRREGPYSLKRRLGFLIPEDAGECVEVPGGGSGPTSKTWRHHARR